MEFYVGVSKLYSEYRFLVITVLSLGVLKWF